MKKVFLNIGILLVGIVIAYFSIRSNHNEVRDNIKSDCFWGKIDTIFLDEEGRMQPCVILKHRGKVYIENDIYKKIKKGDTLFKEKGSFEYHLIKNGDTITFYQQSGNEDIK